MNLTQKLILEIKNVTKREIKFKRASKILNN